MEDMEDMEVTRAAVEDMEGLLVGGGDGLIGIQDMSGIKTLVIRVQIVILDTVTD